MSDVKSVLESLGYKLHDRGNFYHCSAVYRGGDNETAVQVYKDTGCWKDYVIGSKFMPFKALIEKTLRTNNEKVIKKYLSGDGSALDRQRTKSNKLSMEKTYDDSVLERLLPHYSFYLKKGVKDSVLKFFKCGLANSGKMYNRLVFPIYNENGRIHGFAGRHLKWDKDSSYPKWKISGKKGNFCYPLYMKYGDKYPVQDAIQKNKRVVLVESIGDALSCINGGMKDVLVTFGVDISPKLICKLMSLDVDDIVIAFNNDSQKKDNVGLKSAVKNYLKLMNHFSSDKVSICLPIKNDFGEMSGEDYNQWEDKYKNTDREKQKDAVRKIANSMKKERKLSDQLFKNLKKV